MAATITDRQGPEGQYGDWSTNNSEHKHLFIFEIDGQFRFAQMLVKTSEARLRGQSAHYKAVSAKLEIDPVIPLLLVYGIFRPRDVQRFIAGGNQWLRRNWAVHTILLGVPDEIHLADPNSYAWDATVLVQSPQGTDSQYCEYAMIKLRSLTEIRDQNEIGSLVDDLLAL